MLTKLDIINGMLGANGETPVTSTDSQHPSVLSALPVLERVSTEFQMLGWWFNTDRNLTLNANTSGEVIVPSNTLYLELVSSLPYVLRGSRLYDPVQHTYLINESVGVNLVTKLDIEDLPTCARVYIQNKAIALFYLNDDGDLDKVTRFDTEVLKAWSTVQKDERRITKQNATKSPAVARVLYRIEQGGSGYNPMYPGGR